MFLFRSRRSAMGPRMGPADWNNRAPAPPPPLLTAGQVIRRGLQLRVVCAHTHRSVMLDRDQTARALARAPKDTTIAVLWLTGRFRCQCCPNPVGRGLPAWVIQVYETAGYERLVEHWHLGQAELPERLTTGVYVQRAD